MAAKLSVDNEFIKSSFLTACSNEMFQHKWMSSLVWADLIAKFCIKNPALAYNGTMLDRCINHKRNHFLRQQMDLESGITQEHPGEFQKTTRKHGGKRITYYYACKAGEIFKSKEGPFSDAEDLLNLKLTKSKTKEVTLV
jgi:hypothetical protein